MLRGALIGGAIAAFFGASSGPLRDGLGQGDVALRVRTWRRLLSEYDAMAAVYEQHVTDEFFVYGAPAPSFGAIAQHPAFLELLTMRRNRTTTSGGGGAASSFGSTVRFAPDFPVLPTYLPVEEGAAACLGALGLAVADLFELRGGPPQTVTARSRAIRRLLVAVRGAQQPSDTTARALSR
jgi:hypothetical protein